MSWQSISTSSPMKIAVIETCNTAERDEKLAGLFRNMRMDDTNKDNKSNEMSWESDESWSMKTSDEAERDVAMAALFENVPMFHDNFPRPSTRSKEKSDDVKRAKRAKPSSLDRVTKVLSFD